jgi:hypothetical protein
MAAGRIPTTANSPLTAKGDLFTYSTAPARLAVGANATVLTADSSEATGLKWATPAGGGKVLQVVQATYSVQTANSSATYVSTGLTATITPSAASSKVMVFVALPMAPNVSIVTDATIFRGTTAGTNLASAGALAGLYADLGTMNMQFLDSPSTTSAQVYTVAARQPAGVHYSTPSGYTGVITLMEIGA